MNETAIHVLANAWVQIADSCLLTRSYRQAHTSDVLDSTPQRLLMYVSSSTTASSRAPSSIATLLSSAQIDSCSTPCRTSHSSLTRLLDWQLLGDSSEQLFNVLGRLCAGLEEKEVRFLRISFGIGSGHCALIGLFCNKIELVAGKCDYDIFVRLALQFFHPCFGFVQGALSSFISVHPCRGA